MDKLTENLVHYLRSFRHDFGLTQKEFGEKIGMPYYTVEKLEQGKMTAIFKSFDLLRDLAKLRNLNLPTFIDVLDGNKDERGEYDTFSEEVLDLLSKLPVEKQIKVRDFLDISSKACDDDLFQYISSKKKVSLFAKLNKLSPKALDHLIAFIDSVSEDSSDGN